MSPAICVHYRLNAKSRTLSVCVHIEAEYSLLRNGLKGEVSHIITPALWCALHLTHAENHITRAVIRQPWTAVLAFLGLITMAKPIPLRIG